MNIKGFTEVLIDKDIRAGIFNMILTSGLGGMKPNTIMIEFSKKINNKFLCTDIKINDDKSS